MLICRLSVTAPGIAVALAGGPETRQCGRTLPVIGRIDGRVDDILYTMDGRSIGRLGLLFKGDLPIHEAQIIQEALNSVRVRYVPAAGFAHYHERLIIERLRSRFGPVNVIMEPLSEVPRGPNGKFRCYLQFVEGRKGVS
jgi:phenylacetate-CoA ligase